LAAARFAAEPQMIGLSSIDIDHESFLSFFRLSLLLLVGCLAGSHLAGSQKKYLFTRAAMALPARAAGPIGSSILD